MPKVRECKHREEQIMLELNQLYNMDCMTAIRDYPNKYFDLAIVDPPYGGGGAISMGNKGAVEVWGHL
jgi:DNA modification methylase